MTSKKDFDVLVIGAGPASATAAYLLAIYGFKVAVIEKEQFPRFKLCAGLLTRKTIQLLKNLFNVELTDLVTAGIIQNQSRRYGIGDSFGNYLQNKMDYPFHLVDRKAYDALWMEKATDAGAKAFYSQKAERIITPAGQVVTRSGTRFSARYIIGADGVFSRVRVILQRNTSLRFSLRQEQDIAVALALFVSRKKIQNPPNCPVIYFGYIPWGYAWSFPGPQNQILGLCCLRSKARQSLVRGFNSFVKAQNIQPENASRPIGFSLPYGNYISKGGYKNTLLVGDAGGFAEPLLGEGIYYAHKSAQLAVEAIRKSCSNCQHAEPVYSQLLNKYIINELRYTKILRSFLFSLPIKWQLKMLNFSFERLLPKLEEAVQGQRSFKLLLPKSRY